MNFVYCIIHLYPPAPRRGATRLRGILFTPASWILCIFIPASCILCILVSCIFVSLYVCMLYAACLFTVSWMLHPPFWMVECALGTSSLPSTGRIIRILGVDPKHTKIIPPLVYPFWAPLEPPGGHPCQFCLSFEPRRPPK